MEKGEKAAKDSKPKKAKKAKAKKAKAKHSKAKHSKAKHSTAKKGAKRVTLKAGMTVHRKPTKKQLASHKLRVKAYVLGRRKKKKSKEEAPSKA